MGIESRPVHLVGTYKAPDPETAMTETLEVLGALDLRSLSDGETNTEEDQREWWIGSDAWRQNDNPALELVRQGDLSSYKDTMRFGVKPGETFTPDSLGLRYDTFARNSLKLLRRFKAAPDYQGRRDLRLQVGIPSSYEFALDLLGPEEGLKYLDVFKEATADQMQKISEDLGDEGLIQIESPAILVTAQTEDKDLPAGMRRRATAGYTAEQAAAAEEGSHIGIHFCLGDMNNRTWTDAPLEKGRPVVELTEHLVDQWPSGRSLDYIHFPLAGGDKPPLDDPAVVESLQGIKEALPSETRLFVGMAHEKASLREQVDTLRRVEDTLGAVGVAAACGIARGRNHATARLLLWRIRDLALA